MIQFSALVHVWIRDRASKQKHYEVIITKQRLHFAGSCIEELRTISLKKKIKLQKHNDAFTTRYNKILWTELFLLQQDEQALSL